MVGPKKIERILTNIWYILPYRKNDTADGIRYSFYKPYHIFIDDLTSDNDDVRKSLFDKQPELSNFLLEKIHDINTVSMITDPVCIRYMDNDKTVKIYIDEEIKMHIRRRFNLPTVKPAEHFNDGTLLGEPSKEPLYQVDNEIVKSDTPSVKTIVNTKPSKKITRVCLHEGCDTIISVFRSQFAQGRGLFCGVAHSNIHRKDPRVQCTCKTCNMTFLSIIKEEYCSIECDPSK